MKIASERRHFEYDSGVPAPSPRRPRIKQAPSEIDEIDGSGVVMDAIRRHTAGVARAFRGNRRNIKPSSRKVLESAGNAPIVSISVVRAPVQSYINKIINVASRMRVGKRDSETPSQFFHLFFVIGVHQGASGTHQFIVEKNEHINVVPATSDKFANAEKMDVALDDDHADLTINKMLQNAKDAVGTRLYEYTATDANCQRFIYDVLAANGFRISAALRAFILQPVENLIPYWAKKLAHVGTSLANRANLIVEGEGNPESDSESEDNEDEFSFSMRV